MKFSLALFLALCTVIFLLTGCDSEPNSNALPSGPLGVRVDTANGVYTNISPLELSVLLADKNFSLINVHIPYESEIANTDAFIPYNEMDKNLHKLPKGKTAQIVLYCRSGRMSQDAAETLVRLGYTNVWNLDRGMIGWEQARFQLMTKKQQE